METIRISSKVNVVPKSIELDISVIESLEQSILVSEIEVAEDVQIVSDESFAIARVIPPRIEVEEEVEEEVIEGEESEDQAETDESADSDTDDKSEE